LLALVGTPYLAAAILYGVFVAARLLHSVCYVRGIQPFRTLSFGIGALDQVAILGFIAYGTWFS
jgi:prostaglandin-E synthase 1